jgi:hypothetical protein
MPEQPQKWSGHVAYPHMFYGTVDLLVWGGVDTWLNMRLCKAAHEAVWQCCGSNGQLQYRASTLSIKLDKIAKIIGKCRRSCIETWQARQCVWQCCICSSYSLWLTVISIALMILMVASVIIVNLIFSMQNRNKHCYNRWHRWSFEILTSNSESGCNLSPENIRTIICGITATLF